MNSTLINKNAVRRFGLAAFAFFGLLCGLCLLRHKVYPTFFFGMLSFLGIGFLAFPVHLAHLHGGWLKFSRFIGNIITTLLLVLTYFLFITPYGLLVRMGKGKLLPLHFDKTSTTYWKTRKEAAQPKEQFYKRY
jgi:hypothetical protein